MHVDTPNPVWSYIIKLVEFNESGPSRRLVRLFQITTPHPIKREIGELTSGATFIALVRPVFGHCYWQSMIDACMEVLLRI